MMKSTLLFSSLLLPFCFAGCAGTNTLNQDMAVAEAAIPAPAAVMVDHLNVVSAAKAARGVVANRFEAQPGRKVSYTVTLAMSVDDLAGTLRKIEAMVKESGGYVQESNDHGGVLRIPVAKAEELLVEIRLENLRKMRTRLLALLEKAEKVEDALKVEQELNRVVTDIERYEAQLAGLNNRIDYVTLTLRLNQTQPIVFVPQLPVPWMGELGDGGSGLPRPNGCAELPFGLEIPDGFAVLSSTRKDDFRQLWAVSADDCVLRLTRRPGLEGANLDFWRMLARRSLADVNRFTDLKEEAVTLPDGTEAVMFEAKRSSDGYWLCLMYPQNSCCFIPGDREVCLIEFWGPAKSFGERLEAVKTATRSFDF